MSKPIGRTMSGPTGSGGSGARPMREGKPVINVGHMAGNDGPTAAVEHLYQEHPHHFTARGPHHGTNDHRRHASHVKANKGHFYGR